MARPRSSEKEPSSKSSSSAATSAATNSVAIRATTSSAATSAATNKRAAPRIAFHYLTLFPELFAPVLGSSLLGKAADKGLVSYSTTQIRDFAADRHRTVDDTPYGGGEGMLLKADVLHAAWKSVLPRRRKDAITLLMSPQGRPLTPEVARKLSAYRKIILVCGHYEGVDERFIDACVDQEISIGDYVLTGGELPALVVTDAVCRWVPGIVAKERSVTGDSLENGLLKYPQFTRPREFQGREVPEVLTGGNHKAIQAWRQAQMEERTARKRPDLYERFLTKKK
jgi:tRNA (guanine37-N1)-methyltransferase